MIVGNTDSCVYFRRRWDDWKSKGFPEGDSLIVPLLEKLAGLPGVTPVWSCQGHLESDDPRDHRFYIALCATAQGMRCLFQIEQLFDAYPFEERPMLEQTRLIQDFTDTANRPLDEWEEWHGWQFFKRFEEYRHSPDDQRRMINRLEYLVEVVGRMQKAT